MGGYTARTKFFSRLRVLVSPTQKAHNNTPSELLYHTEPWTYRERGKHQPNTNSTPRSRGICLSLAITLAGSEREIHTERGEGVGRKNNSTNTKLYKKTGSNS